MNYWIVVFYLMLGTYVTTAVWGLIQGLRERARMRDEIKASNMHWVPCPYCSEAVDNGLCICAGHSMLWVRDNGFKFKPLKERTLS